MKNFQAKYGPWALVTGASSGLGAEFAQQLAARGLNLVLTARRKDRLEELAERISAGHKIAVKIVPADLAQNDFLEQIIPSLEGLEIGLLVNNAGYALTGRFLEHDLDRELGLLYTNCRSRIILAHYLGKPMVERRRGGMIFVSSLAAFLPMPFWTNYSASKAYDLAIANGLYHELKSHGIDVLALCPGPTQTEFSQVAEIKNGGMKPAPVVSLGLKKLGRSPIAVPGFSNRLMAFFSHLGTRKQNIKIGALVVNSAAKKNKQI